MMDSVFQKVTSVYPKYLALKKCFDGRFSTFEWAVAVFLVFEFTTYSQAMQSVRNIKRKMVAIINDIEETEADYDNEEDDIW